MMNRLSLPHWLLPLFLGAAAVAWGESTNPVFNVGVARRDITPKEPLPMWGYGARHDFLSKGTLDPLYATALAIQAGTNKLAIVGLDLGRAPSEQSLQNIRRRVPLLPRNGGRNRHRH